MGSTVSLGDQLIAETTLLAEAIKRAPHAKVRKYPSWDLAQLGRHVGEIHGWVTGIVRSRATERPARAKLDGVSIEDVPGVLHVGAVALAEALDGCDPADPVWGFAGDGTVAFWRRRMLLETTIHRWDAQDAIGAVTVVPHEVALDGIDECLAIYCTPAMPDWILSRDGPSIVASLGADSCAVAGGAVDLWLLAMGRRSPGPAALRGFEVSGDAPLAATFADACSGVRGPA